MTEPTQIEKSCGAVVFTRTAEGVKYLLVCELEGFWGFPKGHMEQGETEEQTARREIKEETGADVTFVEGFRTTDAHPLAREGRPHVLKQIVYFLAECDAQHLHAQASEISRLELMDFPTAMNAFQFESSKRILREAEAFLAAHSLLP